MSKHTPGPWTAEPDRGSFDVRDSDGYMVAGTYSRLDGEEEANAHLIAAAPDLLDLVRRWHERLTDGRRSVDAVEEWAEEARAAIAKAEG